LLEPGGKNEPVSEREEPTEDNMVVTDRRSFVRGVGAAAIVGLGTAGCVSDAVEVEDIAAGTATPAPAPFRVARQHGVARAVMSDGAVLGTNVLVTGPDDLAALFQTISVEIERLMAAQPVIDDSEVRPPSDAGLLGPQPAPTDLAIVMSVGSSLFDDRFGLGNKRPQELKPMPRFRNDRFMDPALTEADIAFTITANSTQAVTHAVQQLIRSTPRKLEVRWLHEGFNQVHSAPATNTAATRNLLGFKDGTSNPDPTNQEELDQIVWIADDDAEPAWATGGTYQAVRIIRMLIEFWSTVALVRQELIIGRDRGNGAPLGQDHEQEEPAFVGDSSNVAVPPASHMRRANPRTGQTQILRRGFSYRRGLDDSGLQDQGLIFLAYQRSLEAGFIATQRRLDGEALEDYVKPVGGGFFFVLPGPGTGPDRWLGQSLLES